MDYFEISANTLDEGEPDIPVGLVSKHYKLIQHGQVLGGAVAALDETGVDVTMVQADLRMTRCGERTGLCLFFPEDSKYSCPLTGINDTMCLRLHCFNLVYGSARFMALLGWFRFVCVNGLVVGVRRLDFRRRHDIGLRLEDIGLGLRTGLTGVSRDINLFSERMKTRLSLKVIQHWADGDLKKRWGTRLAVRALHIAKTGFDATFSIPFEKGKQSEKTMEKNDPGAWGNAAGRQCF